MPTSNCLTRGLALAVMILSSGGAAPPTALTIKVEAGPIDRVASPLIVAVPAEFDLKSPLRLEDATTSRSIPVQAAMGDNPGVAFLVRGLKAGTSQTYRLSHEGAVEHSPTCLALDDGKAVTLACEGRPVLRYNHAMVDSPPGMDPVYRKNGYIHPLYSPSGREITGDFAVDHPHQHGLFFAWVNTTFAGRKVDFWNQASKTGRVRHMEILGLESGPVFAGFRARLRHEDLTAADGPAPVLDETWTVRAFNADPATGQALVDFESRQTCAGPTPLKILKYHYGSFGFRGNSAWYDDAATGENPPQPSRSGSSDFLTSEGKGRAEGNHARSRWCDFSGKLDGAFAGVSILGYPSNFRFPQPVRLHPNKPYFVFSPSVLGPFSIEPGVPYVSRYRLVPHDGPPQAKAIDALWNDLADPPVASVSE